MKRRIPKTRVFVDVESASDIDIKAVGGSKYCESKTTFPRCVAYAVNGGAPRLWLPRQPVPEIFMRAEAYEDPSEIGFYAYNADGFDLRFFELVLHKRFGWPRIPDELWYDVMCDALACGLPGKLAEACIAAEVREKKDTLGGKVVQLPGMCSPDLKALAKGGKKWMHPSTHPEEFKRLYKYCLQDVVSMRELYMTLPMHVCEEEDQRPHFLDCIDMNRRGIYVDKDTVQHIQSRLVTFKNLHTARLIDITDGEITTPTQRDRIKNRVSKLLGKPLKNMQGAYLDKVIPKLPDGEAKELLEIYKECSSTSNAKYQQISQRICDDGTIKNNFVFHGTGPGRYAARGVQVQNMPRPEKYFGRIAKNEELLAGAVKDIWELDYADLDIIYGGFAALARNLIRAMLMARPGYKFLCADFKSIEARAVPWHCKDEKILALINKGVDLYVLAAAEMYHVSIDEVDDWMRQAGKIAVLACGFEGGWSALAGMAGQYGIILSEDEAREIVRLFRLSRPLMTQAWKSFLKCAKLALKHPGKIFKVPGCQPTFFQKRGAHLFMRLPSNRELVYWGARLEPWTLPWGEVREMPTCMWVNNGPKGNHRWERRAMRGGHFFQNAIQGECSDVLKLAQHKLAGEGYETVLTLHDEPLIQVPDTPDFNFEFFISTFTEGDEWTKGLPIGADGWVGYRFKKA